MKKTLFLILTLVLVAGVCASAQTAGPANTPAASGRETRLLTIEAHDGYALTGKLDLPAGEDVRRVVVFVNGSGPNTYDNRRQMGETEFNYYDLFAEHLTQAGVAFFRYSTRGCTPGE